MHDTDTTTITSLRVRRAEIDRLRHSSTSALLTRRGRDRRRVGVVHLRPRLARGVPRQHGARPASARRIDQRGDPPQARRHALRAQRHEPRAGQVPGAGRHDRDPPRLRGDRRPHRAVRRRGRADHEVDPLTGEQVARHSTSSSSSRPPTTSPATSACARRSSASRPSSRSGWPTSRRRASSSRPSASACARSTTSR